MTLQWPQFVWIAGLLLAWSGALIGAIWFLILRIINQFKDGIEDSHATLKAADAELKSQIETTKADYNRIDTEFKTLLIQLPLHYHRREDAIREYTAINTKLDRLHEIFTAERTKNAH